MVRGRSTVDEDNLSFPTSQHGLARKPLGKETENLTRNFVERDDNGYLRPFGMPKIEKNLMIRRGRLFPEL
ncbi:MAG: hypothetical protein Kow00109_10010 [Acidobacteriota bacterium]